MTTALKKSTVALILLAVIAASAASAGNYYEAVTTTEDQRAGDSEMTVSVWVDGESTKIQFAEGEEVGFFGPGTYMVTTDAGESLYLVNDEEQTYSTFNLGQMMNSMGQMGDMFKIEFTDFYSEKISEGSGEDILGYSTRHLRFRSGYTMNMSIMGMKQEQKVDMDQEVWITDAFDPMAFIVWLRPDKRMGGMFEGLDEMMEQQFNAVDGVPLRSVMHMTNTGKKGKTTTSVTTTEVTALREESVDPAIFQIPAGYQEVQLMPDMGQLEGMQGAEEEDEEQEEKGKRPRLRDLMKRRKDG